MQKNLKAPYIAVAYHILTLTVLQICYRIFSCNVAGKNLVLRVICWLQSCECGQLCKPQTFGFDGSSEKVSKIGRPLFLTVLELWSPCLMQHCVFYLGDSFSNLFVVLPKKKNLKPLDSKREHF